MATAPCTGRARFYSRRAGQWLPLPAHWVKPTPDLPALDQRLRVPGLERESSLRELFAAMRQAGVRPHPGDANEDEQVAGRLLRLLPGPSGRRFDPLNEPQTPSDEPEAHLAPSDWFGVAEPACPTDGADEAVWGRYDQIIGDLADMGCGAIRRFKYRDVYWGSVFPEGDAFYQGQVVLAPAAILATLRADDYRVLAPFTELLLACLLAGIKVAITPFDAGGGSPFNVASDTAAGALDGPEGHPLVAGTWREVFANKPAWQHGIRVPSTQGWDPFYWDHGSPTDGERQFERFAIHVWPTRVSDPVDSSTYGRECARRKSLGIAAFSQGVAEHLVALDTAWRRALGGNGIHAVVETVELGNELNGIFVVPGEPTEPEGEPTEPGGKALAPEVVAASQFEAGRYMVLVAQPFRALLPAMKFRAAELSSWHPSVWEGTCWPPDGDCCITDNFEDRLTWLRDTVLQGMTMAHSVELENQYGHALALSTWRHGELILPASVGEWTRTCTAADYWWPPLARAPSETLSFRVTSLVHQVGLHWYHGYDRRPNTDPSIPWYQDAIRLGTDLDHLATVVVDALNDQGFSVTRSAGEVAFPAVFPDPGDIERTAHYYADANPLLQAGMLARHLLLFRAAGVARTSWFCPYLNPMPGGDDGVPDHWTSAGAGTGLHNDVYRDVGERRHFAAQGAWRRPAWFTYRRVAWLLSLAKDRGTIVHNAQGFTLLRFELKAPLRMAPVPTMGAPGYRFLWVAWVDQFADSVCLLDAERTSDFSGPSTVVAHAATALARAADARASFALHDARSLGCELVSLVPDATEYIRVGETDANGYRQTSPREWKWSGWDAAILDRGEMAYGTGDASLLWFAMQKCGTRVAQAPIAILTDADTASIP